MWQGRVEEIAAENQRLKDLLGTMEKAVGKADLDRRKMEETIEAQKNRLREHIELGKEREAKTKAKHQAAISVLQTRVDELVAQCEALSNAQAGEGGEVLPLGGAASVEVHRELKDLMVFVSGVQEAVGSEEGAGLAELLLKVQSIGAVERGGVEAAEKRVAILEVCVLRAFVLVSFFNEVLEAVGSGECEVNERDGCPEAGRGA